MKKILTISALALTLVAHADEHGLDNLHDIGAYPSEPYPKGYANWDERKHDTSQCKKMGNNAAIVMKHRQNGTPMSLLIDAVDGDEYAVNLIIAAYEERRYESSEYQRKAAEDFSNDAMVTCYAGGRS